MTEADILALSFAGNEAVADLFSIFFTIVSAYLAGLYFFIGRAPLFVKVMAFALLTFGFLFIGQSMAGIEMRILGLVTAWEALPQTASGIAHLTNPALPAPLTDAFASVGLPVDITDGNRFGMYVGWALSMSVYLTLLFATFFYRWPDPRDPSN